MYFCLGVVVCGRTRYTKHHPESSPTRLEELRNEHDGCLKKLCSVVKFTEEQTKLAIQEFKQAVRRADDHFQKGATNQQAWGRTWLEFEDMKFYHVLATVYRQGLEVSFCY